LGRRLTMGHSVTQARSACDRVRVPWGICA
jgi:hypothetical protein